MAGHQAGALRAADGPVPLLALAMVFFCYRHMSHTGAMIRKKSGYIAVVTSAAAATALLLNLLLIPRWGAMGAASATAGAFALEFLVMNSLSERTYPIGLKVRELFAPLAIASGVWAAAAVAVPDGAGPMTGLAIRIAAFGAYAIVLSATGILSPSARQLLIRSAREPRAIMNALRSA